MDDLLIDTPTRLVFTNELVPGSVIVQPCEGHYRGGQLKCDVETTIHGDRHMLTVQRVRSNPNACAIVLTEDGVESPWQMGGNGVVRITADSPTNPQPDERLRRDANRDLPMWKKVLGVAAGIATVLVPFALGAGFVLMLVLASRDGSR
jgi:hypothetical protein